jgi:fructose-1,6-bisphosphatase/inositol monophosphatase family enzyme
MAPSLPDLPLLKPDFAGRIAAQIIEAAHELVLPYFGLPSGSVEIREKADGELVSKIDLMMQDRLAEMLAGVLPGSRILSEEMTDPRSAFDQNRGTNPMWIIDPLDGTSAFLDNRSSFGVAVTLCLHDAPISGWLYAPIGERMAFGSVADGGWLRGSCVGHGYGETTGRRQRPNGVVASGDFPIDYRARIEGLSGLLFESRGTASCVIDYLDLLSGSVDFLLYRRTLPWDHAAGVLLAGIAGGSAIRFDHGDFDLGNWNSGLLVVRNTGLFSELSPLLPTGAEQAALQSRTAN